MIGITMLKVMPGHEKSVYGMLKDMDGIKEAHHLFGEFDFFVILQAEGMKALDKLAKKLQRIEDVTDVWKILVTKEDGPVPSETHLSGSSAYIQDGEEIEGETVSGTGSVPIGELDVESEGEPSGENRGEPESEPAYS